jgi:DNA/RNA endonuclease YhcR with UshA esterase domain
MAGDALKVVGISELVRNREAIFLTQAEKNHPNPGPSQDRTRV